MLICLLSLAAFIGCTGGGNDTETTADMTEQVTVAEDTAASEEETTVAETTAEVEAETTAPAPEGNVPTSNKVMTFYKDEAFADYIKATDCSVSIVEDEKLGTMLKLVSKKGDDDSIDPEIEIDYSAYMAKLGLNTVSVRNVKYIVVLMKVADSESDELTVGYCSEGDNITRKNTSTRGYDKDNSGWQSVIFDVRQASWTTQDMGSVSLQYASGAKEGAEAYIYSVALVRNDEEAVEATEYKLGFNSNIKVEASDVVEHVKLTAEHEDATVNMWFDHITEKTGQKDTESSNRNGYTIRLAKNEISSAQFFLAPETDRSFRIELDTLTHEDGESTMQTTLMYTYYHPMKNKAMMPDAIPLLTGPIEVKGGQSQGFVVQAKSLADTKAGLYSAEIRVYDDSVAGSSKCIKIARIYAYVWDFALTDATSLTVVANLHDGTVYDMYKENGFEGDKQYYYKRYYDFLLDNRVCLYNIPYELTTDEADEYLNNPRVTAFTAWGNNYFATFYRALWDKFKDNPDWKEKMFFYKVDEPLNKDHLNQIKSHWEILGKSYPELKMTSPFFINNDLSDTQDFVGFMTDYIDIWCSKLDSYTPRNLEPLDTKSYNLSYMQSAEQDEKYGTFAERMEAERAKGDTVWTYFCAQPEKPFANWMANGDGVEPIITGWQCKMLDLTGALFWGCMSTDFDDIYSDVTGTPAWGDGCVVYHGALLGTEDPISTLRLEQIRDGVEDYEYLVMFEELYGEEMTDEMINLVTSSVVTFTYDDDYLADVRIMLGNMIEEGLKNKN